MLKARALSIRQPWAAMIVHLAQHCKDIENRNWPTRLRGGFLVHASQGMTESEYIDAVRFAILTCGVPKSLMQEVFDHAKRDEQRGGIVGYAEVIDCIGIDRHEAMPPAQRSRWFIGEYGFALANQQPLPFLPVTGRLSFFEVEVPDDYLPTHLRARLAP